MVPVVLALKVTRPPVPAVAGDGCTGDGAASLTVTASDVVPVKFITSVAVAVTV